MRQTRSTSLKIHHKINQNIDFMVIEKEEKVVLDVTFENAMN